MKREIIFTTNAPSAGFPYSQAVKHGDLVFVAGQMAIDPATGVIITGDIRTQTRLVPHKEGPIFRLSRSGAHWSGSYTTDALSNLCVPLDQISLTFSTGCGQTLARID